MAVVFTLTIQHVIVKEDGLITANNEAHIRSFTDID